MIRINDIPRELICIIIYEKQTALTRFVIKSVSKRFNVIIYKLCFGNMIERRQAFKIAIFNNNFNLCNWLKDRKTDYTEVVQDIVLYNKLDSLKLFKKLGFVLFTSLYYNVVQYGHFEMMKWMIENNEIVSDEQHICRGLCFVANVFQQEDVLEWLNNNVAKYIKN